MATMQAKVYLQPDKLETVTEKKTGLVKKKRIKKFYRRKPCRKKRIVLVLIAIFLVLAGIGGTKKVVEMRQEAQKERQIKFLKRNKDIIINKAFTVDGKLDVKDIGFYWDTVQVEYSGIIKSKPYGLSIR